MYQFVSIAIGDSTSNLRKPVMGMVASTLATLFLFVSLTERAQSQEATAPTKPSEEGTTKQAEDWRQLLPQKGLKGWEVTDFVGKSKVDWDGKQLILEMGDPLNGINYTAKDFPTDNFEISLEANRLEGSDFLCGLTFPVADSYCSLIAGGWGGNLVGLSSIDGSDASENETTSYFEFENEKWYRFRLRVDTEQISVWINDKLFFRQERDSREFSTRLEVEFSKPLGLCAFQSKVAVRDFKWRPIKIAKSEAPDSELEKPKS